MYHSSLCSPKSKARSGSQGFTLVEVLVAAILILLMIMATTATIRHGQAVRAVDAQRQAARVALVTELEKGEYSHSQFDTLPYNFSSSDSVLLDDRGNGSGSDDLKALLVVVVDSLDTSLYGQSLPRKRIKATATWSSLDGKNEVLSLERLICGL